MNLDRQITEIFSLVAVLLVFVLGYFAAFFPQADELVERGVPAGASEADRRGLVQRLRTYRALVLGTGGLAAIVLGLLTPLTIDVAKQWSWHYSTPRAGLLAVDLMLLLLLVVNSWLSVRLSRRIRNLG
jgi:hypothetical protein